MLSEHARHQLYSKLEDVLGAGDAGTLMGYLPPVGWAEVASKDDLRQLEARLDARIDSLGTRIDARMAELEARFEARVGDIRSDLRGQTRGLFLGLLMLQISAAALVTAVAQVV